VVSNYLFEGHWFDIGTLEQYQRAEEAFQQQRDRYLKRESGQQITLSTTMGLGQFALNGFATHTSPMNP
jgi:NDP-sugar pyrophosphorylase family protein